MPRGCAFYQLNQLVVNIYSLQSVEVRQIKIPKNNRMNLVVTECCPRKPPAGSSVSSTFRIFFWPPLSSSTVLRTRKGISQSQSATGVDTERRMRRLSATGIKNPTRRVRTAAPLLRQDQAHNETSAFVFGYRQTTTWKFYAQIVKGVMAATASTR
jgi:hypothetical protein